MHLNKFRPFIGIFITFCLHNYYLITSELTEQMGASHIIDHGNNSNILKDNVYIVPQIDVVKRQASGEILKNKSRLDTDFAFDVSEVVKDIAHKKDIIYVDLCADSYEFYLDDLHSVTKRLAGEFFIKICNEMVKKTSAYRSKSFDPIRAKKNSKCFSQPEFILKNCDEKRMKIWIVATSNGDEFIRRLKNEIITMRDGVLNLVILDGKPNFGWGDQILSTIHWVYCSYNKNQRSFEIVDMYTLHSDSKALVEKSGRWRLDEGLMLTRSALGRGPKNFERKALRIATFPTAPYFYKDANCLTAEMKLTDECLSTRSGHSINNDLFYNGYVVDILDTLAESLNFTYLFIEPPKDQWVFGIGEGDNYSGLVGMAYREEADIVPSSFIVTKERSDVVDFSPSIDFYSKSLFVRSEAFQEDVGWATYSMGFHWTTWLCILSLWFICSTTHSVFRKIKSRFLKAPDMIEDSLTGLPGLSFGESAFMYYGCVVQQGTPNTPSSFSLRFVFGCFWASCVVLYASYTAVITAFLAVNTEEPPFASLKEAVEHSDWEVGILGGTPTYSQIENAKGDFYRKLYSELNSKPSLAVPSDEAAIKKIRHSNFAYFADTVSMRFLMKGNCSIREIKLDMFPSYGHLVYAKNLPFKPILDESISRLSTSGVLDRYQQKYWTNIAPCKMLSPFSELGFSHTLTAFLLLLLGFILAATILIVEIMENRKNRIKPIVINKYSRKRPPKF